MEKILFLCTGNSCRSQMAEGFLRYLAGNEFQVYSAGVEPSTINPLAVMVMAEIGIDISNHKSKSVQEFLNEQFAYVITVCDHARQICPLFPGKHQKLHWNIEDPANAKGNKEEKLIIFRKIRDDIKDNILEFIKNKKLTKN